MRKEIGNGRKSDLQKRTFGLDWESLRTVLAVARSKSLAGAARALELQHSTVFRRIEEVERRLGQPLFDRNRGGWTANELGETAARAAQAMEDAALEAERRLLGADGRLEGIVRLATSEMIGGYLLPRLVRDFLAEHPGLEVELDVSNRNLAHLHGGAAQATQARGELLRALRRKERGHVHRPARREAPNALGRGAYRELARCDADSGEAAESALGNGSRGRLRHPPS